ncbi:uncharacterized protein [Aegilops tauschii subsp. strangulata]|uniref:uncharacterized protein n=1 Tax=Aegilops tauschii subsp. strangulata TaxID=200361 RepID=UPI003CC848FB
MPFGLCNAGATFQRLMHIALGQQLGRNVEAYVDDVVVKSREARTLIKDLEETFASLRKVDLRLNPEKCVFGVPSGKLLGFLVSHRGIKANPEKVKAIERMSPPQTLKEMQKLAGCVTSLGRFISKLGEYALPLFKLMKKKGPFEWTPEADAAFQVLKKYLTSPPVMVAPCPLEPLVLYLAATPHSASAALVAVREEHPAKGTRSSTRQLIEAQQLQDGAPEASATPIDDQAPEDGAPEATAGTENGKTPKGQQTQEVQDLANASSLVEHPVYFVSTVLREARARYPMPQKLLLALLVASRKLTTRVIKGVALTDFVVERTDVPGREVCEDRSLLPGDEAPDGWIMYFDGAFARQGAGAGAVPISPTKDKLYYTGDSQLLVNFSNKEYTPKDEHMEAYLEEHVPRGTNKEADDIAKRASRRLPQEPGVFEEWLIKPSAAPLAVESAPPQEDLPRAPTTGAPACSPISGAHLLLALEPREGCWTEEFKVYLLQGTLPEKEEDEERVAR